MKANMRKQFIALMVEEEVKVMFDGVLNHIKKTREITRSQFLIELLETWKKIQK